MVGSVLSLCVCVCVWVGGSVGVEGKVDRDFSQFTRRCKQQMYTPELVHVP